MSPTISLSDLTFAPPEWDDDRLDINVYWKKTNHEVAYVHCRHHPDGIIELEDIVVQADYALPRSRCCRLFRRSATYLNFRGGSALGPNC